MFEPRESWGRTTEDIDRFVSFSDAIFAFSMTLLVLSIAVPVIVPGKVAGDLQPALLAKWPEYLQYVISFMLIGNIWISHDRMFHYIKGHDRWLIWINLFLLLCITFIPFPTALIVEYGDQGISVLIFSINLFLVSSLNAAVWWYATGKLRLVEKGISDETITYYRLRSLIGAPMSILAIIVGLIDPSLAKYIWILSVALYIAF
jgi:uncharacterized membrane protein